MSTKYSLSIWASKICTFISSLKSEKFKNLLDILNIGTIAWLSWVLSSQIEKISTLCLLSLIVLFEFIAEGFLVFPSYSSIKVFIARIIIAASLFLSQYYYKADARGVS